MKVIWLDTETTGLDPVRHDIWQLAYILTDNGKEVYRHVLECQPFTPWTADHAALAVGITIQGRPILEIAKLNYVGFMKPWSAIDRFIGDLQRMIDRYDKNDKAAIGGYNVVFDLNFLTWWTKKALHERGLGSYTDYTVLDAAPMVRLMRHTGFLQIESARLGVVCQHYDVTLGTAHNAMADAEAAMQVFPCVLADFKEMLSQEQYYGQLTAGEIE